VSRELRGTSAPLVEGLRRGMGGHHRTVGASDEWYTPPSLFDVLGLEFDLDPCAPAGGLPWIPARRFYSLDDDGLSQPWEGRVWLNPPYGARTAAWVRRLAAHGHGIALVFARTDTTWFHDVAPTAHAITFLAGRLNFVPERPEHVDAHGLRRGLRRSDRRRRPRHDLRGPRAPAARPGVAL
jgi:hypothetical protein